MKKKLIALYFIIVGVLVGVLLIGLDRKPSGIFSGTNDIVLTQDVFEYGEGTISIPIYKYVENKEDFYSVRSTPIVIGNKDIGTHDIVFTVSPKNDKTKEIKIIKVVEVRDTQPAKIYPNRSWVDSNYCGQMLASVMDPVDGLLDYKENLNDNDRGYYTVYQEGDKRIIKAIDKNGNVSEMSIDNYSGDINHNTTLNEETIVNNSSGCSFEQGFDGVYYLTQDQAIESARNYFNSYQAQENPPKSFNVYVTTCDDTVYYIWDFIW